MTEAQRERLREIADIDRRIYAELCGPVHDFLALRVLRQRRADLRVAPYYTPGRAPQPRVAA